VLFVKNKKMVNKGSGMLESYILNITEKSNPTSHFREINFAFAVYEKSSPHARFTAEESEQESGETISLQ